jgi:hypothetical protein
VAPDGTRKVYLSGSDSLFLQKYNIEIEETDKPMKRKPILMYEEKYVVYGYKTYFHNTLLNSEGRGGCSYFTKNEGLYSETIKEI